MHYKSFIFGIGSGILIVSIIFYAGVLILNPFQSKKITETVAVEIQDEEIIEKARKLGMIFIKELPESLPVQGNAVQNEKPDEYPDETADLEQGPFEETEDLINSEEADLENNKEAAGEKITVTIISGSNTIEVADLLYNSGIIENPQEFISYVTVQNKTKKIIAGSYELSSAMSYDEILNILIQKS